MIPVRLSQLWNANSLMDVNLVLDNRSSVVAKLMPTNASQYMKASLSINVKDNGNCIVPAREVQLSKHE